MPLLPRRARKSVVSSPQRVPTDKNALTAGGQRVRRGDAQAMRQLVQPWQGRALAYYELLGEIHYAAQFYSRMLSPLRLFAAELDPVSGEVTETKNPKAIETLNRMQDPGGGRTGLLGTYGRLMFLVGEALLLVTIDENGDESWEMLSRDELRVDDNGRYLRMKAPSLNPEELREPDDEDAWEPAGVGEAVVYRLWQRHPRFSELADSTMRGVLDLCEELVLLTQAVRSRARSRLAGAGLLFLDGRISPVPPNADDEPDDDVQNDPLLNDLTEAMTAPIADEGAASAVVPLLVRVPVDDGRSIRDLVYHLQIVDPTQLYPETGLRMEAIRRLAIGLDMPPEALTGTGEVNHWGSWMIDEQTWKGHGQGKAQQLCDDLTSSFFRPTLKQQGVTDYQRYVIAYDPADVINRPDRTTNAREAFDRETIGKTAYRDALGFDEDDAMPDDEIAERIGIKVRDPGLAIYGIPTLRSGSELEPAAGEIEAPPPPGETTDPSAPSDVTKGAPPQPDEKPPPEPTTAGGNGSGVRSAHVMGAAHLALLRTREVAGNRLKGAAKRDPDLLALIDGVRAGQVAAVLGRERVRSLRCDEATLVAGVRDLIADALHAWGITDKRTVDAIVSNVEAHAAATLYDETPAPLPEAITATLTA